MRWYLLRLEEHFSVITFTLYIDDCLQGFVFFCIGTFKFEDWKEITFDQSQYYVAQIGKKVFLSVVLLYYQQWMHQQPVRGMHPQPE